MAGSVRILRRRISSARNTKKITGAMELVAGSRITKARERVATFRPYAAAMTSMLATLAASAGSLHHPLLRGHPTVRRVGVLVITSDRGLCGGYNVNVIHAAEQLISHLHDEGRAAALYVVGGKGVGYYRLRNREIVRTWTGFSEQPTFADARRIGQTLAEALMGQGQVEELHAVFTRFGSLLIQTPTAVRFAPAQTADEVSTGMAGYEVEPDPGTFLDALGPRYVIARVYAALTEAAASESAARRRAMKTATDNAEEVIASYTRDMNTARQAAITEEINEIVGGANALTHSAARVGHRFG
jgi:F-type H+-transporting ATPase subunit gamma